MKRAMKKKKRQKKTMEKKQKIIIINLYLINNLYTFITSNN